MYISLVLPYIEAENVPWELELESHSMGCNLVQKSSTNTADAIKASFFYWKGMGDGEVIHYHDLGSWLTLQEVTKEKLRLRLKNS